MRVCVRVCVAHTSCRMGYDLDRFVGYVNEGLLCCVCRDVLERPLQAPCEHAYCSACISSWLIHHSSCPEDRLPLDAGSLKPLYRCVLVYVYVALVDATVLKIQTFSLLMLLLCSDGRYMRNDLTRLQIRCVNAAQGCEAVCSLESLQSHEDQCQFAFVPCTNACELPFGAVPGCVCAPSLNA